RTSNRSDPREIPIGYQTASRSTVDTRLRPPYERGTIWTSGRSASAPSRPRTWRAVPASVWTRGLTSMATRIRLQIAAQKGLADGAPREPGRVLKTARRQLGPSLDRLGDGG